MSTKCPKCHTENPDNQKFCGECATPLDAEVIHTKTLETPIVELTTGSTFAGRYQIIEELGKGGMGRVYKVHDEETKEKIALKLIKPEIASDKKTIERFRNELTAARKISHRYVCRMYDLNRERDSYYITMEYIPGQDLRGFIKQSDRLSIQKAVSIAKQICEGLEEAHNLGIVHRDLKPANVMIDKEGNTKIMDFGIARSVKGKGITGSGVMIGTPEYMSPEQAEAKEVDQRSDIYSLGVILYEMVTGKVPFEGEIPFGIAMKHKTEMPKDPRELNSQLSEDLCQVILRCMEKDKEKRYQSAVEAQSELENIEKGIPTTGRMVPKREPKTVKTGEIKWKSLILYCGAAVLLILLIVIGRNIFFPGHHKAIDSIAVLPLANLSGDSEQEYFADGMTDALISNLATIGAIHRVISRTSVMQYKEAKKALPEIAQELDVDAIVEGTVLLIGERVRITAQLIEARKDRNLWAKSYEHDINNILALQSEIAQTIAREIEVTLTPEEETRLTSARSVNPEAYNAYLKGCFYLDKRTEEALKKGLECFRQAIKKDPTYALAYAGLADCYSLLGGYDYLPPNEAHPRAKAAAKKALKIDNNLAEAHTSLAFVIYLYDRDWSGAEREFNRAIDLNQNYATAHHWYAYFLATMGRHEESVTEMKRAQELDPLSLIINAKLAQVFYFARQYEKAIEQYKKTLEMDPNYIIAHWYLGMVYVQKGMYNEAIIECQTALDLSGGENPLIEASLGYIYSLSGKRDEANKVLEELLELSKQRWIPPYFLAIVYLGVGQKNQAFQCLEKAYEEHDDWLVELKVEPCFDSLRSDMRFKEFLKKINLEK